MPFEIALGKVLDFSGGGEGECPSKMALTGNELMICESNLVSCVQNACDGASIALTIPLVQVVTGKG